MSKARNMIIDGHLKGQQLHMDQYGLFYIFNGRNPIETIKSYEILSEETEKDVTSTVGRGVIGSALFGNAGISASLTGKENKKYTIRATWFRKTWRDQEKYSILELDQEFYKMFLIKSVCTPEQCKRIEEGKIPSKYSYDVDKWLADNNIPNRKDPRADVWWDCFFEKTRKVPPEENPMLDPYRSINPEYEEYMKVQQQNQETQSKDSVDNTENADIKSKLKELKSIYEEDLITEEEYNNKKQELLSEL